LQGSCLTDSALVGAFASEARAVGVVEHLEELGALVAPKLATLARADAVRVCRVAELVRVNINAKQTRL
jgi:hypothetical protein